MLDPSDMSTLFQDEAGTIPVTAVEQPVGRILDLSERGNHATQSTTTKRPVYSRRVNLMGNSSASGFANYDVNVTLGAAQGPDGSMSAALVSPAASSLAQLSQFTTGGTGNYTAFIIVKKKDFKYVKFLLGSSVSIFDLDAGVFLSALTGYFSQALGNGWYLVGATNSMVGGWTIGYQFSSTTETGLYFNYPDRNRQVVPDADGIKGNYFAGGSLTLATDAHLPYQWVNTATDYDADPGKFPAYLKFDGIDDGLQTGNIDFTSTDKMTVWAGVTKLSDAATGTVVELSASKNANNGVFALFAPLTSGALDISWYSKGTNERVAGSTSESAPVTRVITGIGDISGDISRIRVNGAVVQTETAYQGTGNYGNYPLYIGARAGTSLFFNGRLYSLIVRGAQSSLSEIEATEAYIKQKMRMP